MNDKVWFALARRIQDAFEKNEADGVIVTYGTDTLEETAFFLDNVLRGDKPVVIVGSMRPATAVGAQMAPAICTRRSRWLPTPGPAGVASWLC